MKPEKLLQKTRLTKEQFEQVKNFPEANKFKKRGDVYVQSLTITKALFKARQKAEKFILCLSENGMAERYYLKNSGGKLTLTSKVKDATQFAFGFDIPSYCEERYHKLTGLHFKVYEILKTKSVRQDGEEAKKHQT